MDLLFGLLRIFINIFQGQYCSMVKRNPFGYKYLLDEVRSTSTCWAALARYCRSRWVEFSRCWPCEACRRSGSSSDRCLARALPSLRAGRGTLWGALQGSSTGPRPSRRASGTTAQKGWKKLLLSHMLYFIERVKPIVVQSKHLRKIGTINLKTVRRKLLRRKMLFANQGVEGPRTKQKWTMRI